ncbi:trehalose-phosphatase [Qipengyuania marisflavi]|uniref:Trehalose 6-phosphate phosphatase n=1 Tax=Qipengyuania marisflavi TaxID=2486356 RepID=A0A5S3PAA2_9SPHN|nr:trehalose-phosphatase [Qipengyuania marisflavi]TMM50293.1 trehalose-phosphatase [Qipengyuania marisflavi]
MPSVTTLPAPPALPDLMAAGPIALFVDFDGTLVEIASGPDAIVVPDTLTARLHDLRNRMVGRLALVSGRALDDLEKHIGSCEIARAGSHGASCLMADGSRLGTEPEPLPADAIHALRDFAQSHDLTYEAKQHGGALHYRARPDLGEAALAFARQIAAQHGLVVKTGKAVAELVHPGADKAGAVRAFMAEAPFAGATPIFIGDDVTDEDGFAAAIEFSGFGIAVGDRQSEAARYRLDSVTAVHHWLDL